MVLNFDWGFNMTLNIAGKDMDITQPKLPKQITTFAD